jgi:hypothetical protein
MHQTLPYTTRLRRLFGVSSLSFDLFADDHSHHLPSDKYPKIPS